MDINSLQGASAYTNASGSTSPVDNAQLRDQNVEASRTELNQESTTAAQQAFEVTITQEAQRLSAEKNEESAEVAAQQLEDQNNSNTEPAHETSQIVNIVA